MVKLITSAHQAVSNIQTYSKSSKKLADTIPYVRAWYAIKDERGQWIFGASKFIGYDELSVDEYMGRNNLGLDGRVTEGVLKRWFEEVYEGHPQFNELWDTLAEFCSRHGKKPNTLARIAVLRDHLDNYDELPNENDEIIQLLVAVFKKLTPAEKERFRVLAK